MVKCLGRWGKHSIKQGAGDATVGGVSTINGHVTSNQCEHDGNGEPGDGEEVEELQICCLSGCLTMITVGVLFFLALPTGVLLCVFASSNNDPEVLAVGIVLAVSPIISMPLIVVVLYNRRRIQQLRKRKVSSTPVHSDKPPTYRQRY